MNIFRLKPAIQNYAWGGDVFIPKLVGVEAEEGLTYAEVWMGAHQRGPALTKINGAEINLAELVKENPRAHLGDAVIERFGESLPYLFKVLDVKKMLSIQAHPTKAAAMAGFQTENEKGIPITALHRNYKDDNHKPEVMVALSDFYLLHGFKSQNEITEVLEKVESFHPLQIHFADQNIKALYKAVMEMPQEDVNILLNPLKEKLLPMLEEGGVKKESADYWAALAFTDYPENCDRGIFSIYFFNLVRLKKGEGIFQDAGIPHAYLDGINVELMANSDNVFRGGLTQKYIDVNELLEHLVFQPVVPEILKGEVVSETEKVYATPAPDFELSEIRINPMSSYIEKTKTPETLILIAGNALLESDGQKESASKGDIFFLPPGITYTIVGEGIFYKAKVPL